MVHVISTVLAAVYASVHVPGAIDIEHSSGKRYTAETQQTAQQKQKAPRKSSQGGKPHDTEISHSMQNSVYRICTSLGTKSCKLRAARKAPEPAKQNRLQASSEDCKQLKRAQQQREVR